MTHGMIRRFQISGTIAEKSDMIKTRENFERVLDMEMRDQGWVPLFDVAPAWSTSYNDEESKFDFQLTIQGVWVGTEKAWTIEGISEGKALAKPTPSPKSSKSWER